jgi:hypothetical protein
VPKPSAEPHHASELTRLLHDRGQNHLRVRKRGAVLTIESGPDDAPWRHARLRRDTVHLWTLEMATRGATWERTPFRAQMGELVEVLTDMFPWTIEPMD